MSLEARLLTIILETMFMVLLELDFSPSMKRSLMEKKSEFKELIRDHKSY